MKYNINDYVKTVNYQFGVCQIIETDYQTINNIKKSGENPSKYISLRSLENDMIVILEKEKVIPLALTKEFENELLNYNNLSLDDDLMNNAWYKQYQMLINILKENTPKSQLKVVKVIMSKQKARTFGEMKMLFQAVSLFASEYSKSADISKLDVIDKLKEVIPNLPRNIDVC